MKFTSPYIQGCTLCLKHSQSGAKFDATIEHVYTPSTQSVVVQISFKFEAFNYPPLHKFILKVYDRRFATDLYDELCREPYSHELEESYIQHLVEKPPSEDEYKLDTYELADLVTLQADRDNAANENDRSFDSFDDLPEPMLELCKNGAGSLPTAQTTSRQWSSTNVLRRGRARPPVSYRQA